MGILPKITFGDYPAEYNPKVHGPWDPARFYGKPDTPFGEVKLGELKSWIGRRNKSVKSTVGLFTRAYWRWNHKYILTRKSSYKYVMQYMVPSMILWYTLNFHKRVGHRHAKYH